MPKIKMPRKSTNIDMTPMVDVAFLLLTFFILATRFKPMTPIQVVTPASTSSKTVPTGFIKITLTEDGRIFWDLDNMNAKKKVIERINNDKNLGLTKTEMQTFVSSTVIGVPFSQLKSFLDLPPKEQEFFAKDKAPGIPTDTTANTTTNELSYWITISRYALIGSKTKARIIIKAAKGAKYPEIHKVIATLGKLKIFRFSFVTNSRGVPPGTPLAEEEAKAKAAAGS